MTAPRTVLITGAAVRVGAAIARRLAADGWNTIIHYNRSAREAQSLAAEIGAAGGICRLVQADLRSRPDVEGLMDRCVAMFGPLDCLINNASTFYYDDISSVTWDSLTDHLSSNLIAPIFLCRDFVRCSRNEGDGCIVNILDQKLTNLNPDFLSYTIGKAGLASLTAMLAMALAGRIRVCGIAPGIALISGKQTPESFDKAWRAPPLGRSTTPDEIAACVRYILSASSMTGNTIVLDGGESLAGRARDVAFDSSV
ncbi:MAG: SDR family oxidoreductase [Acetobacteraceae bacterium]|nr:SDR family oxidoreductase [Acetobacteraceae bacterium]